MPHHRVNRPTAVFRRWGVFFFLLGTVLLLACAGCASRGSLTCLETGDLAYGAGPDSLGLDGFLELSLSERESRRRLARKALSRADGARRPDVKLRGYITASGLAPDDPAPWIRQADLWRWVGDYLRTESCLDAASAAVRAWDETAAEAGRENPDKRRAAMEVAVLRAWLNYDRAEWRDATSWARAAKKVEEGNIEVMRIAGLAEASLGRRGAAEEIASDLMRRDEFASTPFWVRGRLETARGRDRAAYNAYYNLRHTGPRAAEAYRDMGLAAERVGDWSSARRWYRESFANLPLDDASCLRAVSRPRISDATGQEPLPFWLAFDRHFVTGSLSAYTAYAYERFEAVQAPAQREAWAGRVVSATGICQRHGEEVTSARLLRGRVFAATGMVDRAVDDFTAVLKALPQEAPARAGLEAEIGHLLLLAEDHEAAIIHLDLAVRADPDLAGAWSDLGLAQVMAGNRPAAIAAFGKALALDPSLTTAWYNRGLMHLHARNLDLAERDLGRAAELAPDNQDIAKLLQQVRLRRRAGP